MILLAFLACLAIPQVFGQESALTSRHKWGFDLGYGTQGGLDVNYYYEVYQLQYQYYFRLLGKEIWSLEFLAQPQFNISRYRENADNPEILKGHEYGLNGGFLFRLLFLDNKISPYTFISAGPHHVSGVPDRQSPGFIFSDNFFTGLQLGLSNAFYLDLRFGFRHISNAGLQNPNGGVNNWIGNVGFLTIF